MFEHLARFRKILVTGPQRSGTTICGQMIAYDIGCRYVDEMRFGVRSLKQIRRLLADQVQMVIQCPALCRWAHELAEKDPENVAVVLMRRRVRDIIASQERINWTRRFEPAELSVYGIHDGGCISVVKYTFWETVQQGRIKHAFEVPYESLKGHPLWVSKSRRRFFKAKQTRI
jgi:hypothetical protein